MSINETNDHLGVVFREMLPAIENAGFSYWACGGIAVAGVLGRFIRRNNDVDIYLRSTQCGMVRDVLATIAASHRNWELRDSPLLKRRPKANVDVDGSELLSVVPVYETPGGVEFRTKVTEVLPSSALRSERKSVGGFTFFSPPAEVVKALLRSLLVERPDRLTSMRSRRRVDALQLFTPVELEEIQRSIAAKVQRRPS